MNRIVAPSVIAFLLGLGLAVGVVLGRERASAGLIPAALADSLGLSNDSVAALAQRDSAGIDALAVPDFLAAATEPAPADLTAPEAIVTPPAVPASATPAAADETRLDRQKLGKIYAAMSAKEAARVLNQMEDAEVQTILSQLRDRQAAAILSAMPPERAAVISRAAIQTNGGPR